MIKPFNLNMLARFRKGGFTIEYFQNPSDLAVHEKQFISRGFKMIKNLTTHSDNFSKKKKHYKISKNFFCIFPKINFVFFLYIFKESKYFFIFLDISTCLHK